MGRNKLNQDQRYTKMVFVKVLKSKAYFKRYQTKFRRRREGKTDYYARQKLIVNDRDKYNTPKYRLVVRPTSQKIVCQITYATLKGDKVLCSAESSEFRKWGLKTGLKNYPSAYATGLLLGKRLLKQLKMDNIYKGIEKINGELYNVNDKPNDERRPFKACLDIGLSRATIGNRVFGAMKGACDAGIYIPHTERKFPGFIRAEDAEEKDTYDPKIHREKIYGVHIDKYMKELKENQEDYNRQFSIWDKQLKEKNAKSCEDLYTQLHKYIKEHPERAAKKEEKKQDRTKQMKFHQKKLSKKQKKENALKRIQIALAQQQK
eukprot:TRINITY_DN162_c0_g1_i3.p1 TRINITY_DN162_c0_g1~~TRINITY_DN162_c0_g1_i3.p1  ORF type:complete len:319 (-),score=81.89 TRINITY_DN162_c0_g1_i3:50-1006(-)